MMSNIHNIFLKKLCTLRIILFLILLTCIFDKYIVKYIVDNDGKSLL